MSNDDPRKNKDVPLSDDVHRPPAGPAVDDEDPNYSPMTDKDGNKRPLREIEPDGTVRPLGTDEDAEEEVRRPIEHPSKDAPGF